MTDSDTLVLLKANNAGSGTFVDESSYARTITKNGTVTQVGAAAKYGAAGIRFGGTSADFLSWADAAEFNLGMGDFTIEGWAKTPDDHNYQNLFWMGNSNTETHRNLVYMDNTGGIRWFWKQGAFPTVNNLGNSSDPVAADTWFHWCVQRSGDNVYVHKDGAQIDFDFGYAAVSMFDFTGDLRLGVQDLAAGELPWLGDMDEFRFSKVARYGAGTFIP